MAALIYVRGDATDPQGPGPKVIAHCCNNQGAWGAGFVMAISERWKKPREEYRAWIKGKVYDPSDPDVEVSGPGKLGAAQFVKVEDNIWIANIIGQHGIGASGGRAPIRYDAVRQGLEHTCQFAVQRGGTVHMPKMGTGLAQGSWPNVEALVNSAVVARGIQVSVYTP